MRISVDGGIKGTNGSIKPKVLRSEALGSLKHPMRRSHLILEDKIVPEQPYLISFINHLSTIGVLSIHHTLRDHAQEGLQPHVPARLPGVDAGLSLNHPRL